MSHVDPHEPILSVDSSKNRVCASLDPSQSARPTFVDARFTFVRLLLGLVLVVASALKLYQIISGSVLASQLLLESEALLGITILWEIFFGVWLILLGGVFPRITWVIATIFFCILAGVAFAHVWRGETCPCLGGGNPWIALSVDFAAILGLVFTRPAGLLSPSFENRRTLAWIAAGAVLGMSLPAAMFLTATGRRLVYGAAGYPLIPDRFRSDVSLPADGGIADAEFLFDNLSDAPVTVLGVQTTCGCVALSDVPATIQPRSNKLITFKIVSGPIRNRMTRSEWARLYLDTPSPPIVLTLVIHEGV